MAASRTLVVADSGPLIALAGADCLPALHALFARVLMPTIVRDEIAAPPPGRPGAAAVLASTWLEVIDPPAQTDPFLSGALDQGEAAVIAVARSIEGAMVLIDEKRGRRVAATAYRLEVVGTAGVLVRAKAAGLVPVVGPILKRIVENGYFLSERLVRETRVIAGE